jgi:caa(3)-type oxidase subunit IV
MESGRPHPNYVKIWVWLLGLMAVGLAATLTPGGHAIGIIVIFATATAKALLVALNYMHLRFEPRLICVIALVPVVFALILAITLFPDFVFRR